MKARSEIRRITTKEESLDDVDMMLLRRLANFRGHLKVAELVNENRDHDLTAAEVLERMQRLEDRGYVEGYTAFRATLAGAAALPRVHHHRTLSKAA